jgi:hypothetical protein
VSGDASAERAFEECLERIDHTRALLERQLTELHGICVVLVDECEEAGRDSSQCYDLRGLSGHMMGMAIAAMRIDGATEDNIMAVVNMTLGRDKAP